MCDTVKLTVYYEIIFFVNENRVDKLEEANNCESN